MSIVVTATSGNLGRLVKDLLNRGVTVTSPGSSGGPPPCSSRVCVPSSDGGGTPDTDTLLSPYPTQFNDHQEDEHEGIRDHRTRQPAGTAGPPAARSQPPVRCWSRSRPHRSTASTCPWPGATCGTCCRTSSRSCSAVTSSARSPRSATASITSRPATGSPGSSPASPWAPAPAASPSRCPCRPRRSPASPRGVGAHAAAVIGLAGIAAHDALEALDVQRGETVLISGATGGVGSIALQLAAAAGATVIATARPGQEEEYVRGLGAAHTVDYTGDVAAAVRAIAPHGVDKALHAAGDAAAIGKVMRAGGGVASTLAATAEQLGRDDVTVTGIMAAATAGKLARLLDHVASGNLRVNIEARVPLDRAHEALKTFADGTLGKVLITR